MTVDLASDRPGVKRDRFKRPMVIPPDGGEPVAYTRATTYAGALEDRYNLGLWEMRMVALGLSVRDDLRLAVAALGTEPDKIKSGSEYRRWKDDMDRAAAAAKEAAAASQWATIGTALHSYTEKIDNGLDLGHVPETYRPHLDLFREVTADLQPVAIERFMINDEFRIGGTPDRIYRIPGHDKLIIGDVKTGDTTWGVGKISIQLGIYAHCVHYDPATGSRSDPGPIDTDTGLVIALNARTGSCELKWIDIATGWAAVDLAHKVRAWRRRKDYAVDPPSSPIATVPPITDHVNAALVTAIDQAATTDELVLLWKAAGDHWTPDHTKRAADRKAALQGGN